MGFGTELLFVVALGLVVLETLRRSLGHTKMSTTLEIYTLPIAAAQRQAVENLSRMVTNGDELRQIGEKLPRLTQQIQ